jgi:hypothetical protein
MQHLYRKKKSGMISPWPPWWRPHIGRITLEYLHHYLGDWVRNNTDTSSTRDDPVITCWDSLDDVPEFERKTFEFMVQHGLTVTSCGAHVYQIRRN